MNEERYQYMSEEDFLEILSFEDLKRDYNSEIRARKDEIQSEFESRKDFLEKSKRSGIETDRRHRDLINSCVFPFTNKGSLAQTGYRFVRAAPLVELNIPNLDFLLFKYTNRFKIAILGECKGSISNYSDILKELKIRREKVQQNIEYIKENYLQLTSSDTLYIEYVIAVPTNDAVEMLNHIIGSEGKQIVWQAAIAGNPEISIAFPPRNINVPRESMMHRDPQLNRALDPTNHTQSNRSVFNVFPQCNKFIKLCSLIRAARSGDAGLIVGKEDLRSVISQDLFYMEDDIIDTETEDLLSKGEDIGFLEWTDDPDHAYKIKARGTKRSNLEKQMEEKWIKYQVQCDL